MYTLTQKREEAARQGLPLWLMPNSKFFSI